MIILVAIIHFSHFQFR